MKCRKCGSDHFATSPNAKNPNATDLFCLNCGTWIKFATKEEIRLYANSRDNVANEKAISDRVEITIAVYFRIHNAELFGGMGSIGYSAISHEKVKDIYSFTDDYVENLKHETAKMFGVAAADLDIIDSATYEAETNEDSKDI